MEAVDDMFKSFVTSKLKQLGMNGMKNAEEELEETLKKSLTATNKINTELKTEESSPSDDKSKHKKQKHKKKKKKHKEHKKKSHKDKENDVNNDIKHKRTLDENERQSDKEKSDQPLKKKLILDTDEVEIKDKTLNCYHDTVSKIKEIEQLTLQVEPEDEPDSVTECTKSADQHMSPLGGITRVGGKLPTETECPTIEPQPRSSESTTANEKTTLSETIPPTESTLVATLKEIKSMTEMGARAIAKDNPEAVASGKDGPGEVSGNQESNEQSGKKSERRHRKHSSRRRSRSRSSSRSRKRSHKSRRHRSRSRSRSRHRHHRHHSRSSDHRKKRRHHRKRSLSPIITKEDKVKLLAIAKANVMAQHKADLTINNLSNESKAVLRSGGFTVEQLTDVCKDIADGKREVDRVQAAAQPAPTAAPLHHPYQVKTAPPISFNIKSTPIPRSNKPITELTKEFPVSCGSQHQRDEVYGKWEPVIKDEKDGEKEKQVEVAAEEPSNTVLIQNVIAERVHAVRELQSNPTNETAKQKIADSQNKLNSWTNSMKMPGRFTGSTSLQPLSRSELEKGHSAWANTQSFNSAKQVEGIGKSLLEKMGWRAGESLGKTNLGLLEPLKVNVKTDRKGLSSFMEAPAPVPQVHKPVVKDLSGKHPVSALMELCTKRRWPAPDFRLVMDSGPDHSRSFLFKVTVNNTAYQPAHAALNKKIAKAQAAEAALKAMGLLLT